MQNKKQHTEDQDLNKVAPTLAKLEKKNNFKVPQNYFDSLINQVEEKVSDNSALLNNIPKQNNFNVIITNF